MKRKTKAGGTPPMGSPGVKEDATVTGMSWEHASLPPTGVLGLGLPVGRQGFRCWASLLEKERMLTGSSQSSTDF